MQHHGTILASLGRAFLLREPVARPDHSDENHEAVKCIHLIAIATVQGRAGQGRSENDVQRPDSHWV